MNYGFVIDNRKCIGCHACSTACKSENEVPLGVYRTWVKYTEVGKYPDVSRRFQVTRCNHCDNAPCVRICPVTAMYKREDGIVDFDHTACIGCKACMQACPYDSIHINPENNTAAKCNYCAHRVESSLEPSCVVVCPTHAIISGDLDDPQSEISQVLGKEKVTVRKPEQATAPKLFYIDGDSISLNPTAVNQTPESYMWAEQVGEKKFSGPYLDQKKPGTKKTKYGDIITKVGIQGAPARGNVPSKAVAEGVQAEHMVQVAYTAQHKVPWHWQVPSYLVTKGLAAGSVFLMSIFYVFQFIDYNPMLTMWVTGLSTFFMTLTTILLVADLERPDRFLYILLRPNWSSWLARGSIFLITFTNLVGLWFVFELAVHFGFLQEASWMSTFRYALALLAIPFGIGTKIYTAFLFGQAEGRDLWQSSLLPFHMLVQGVFCGAGILLFVDGVVDLNWSFSFELRWIFIGALVTDAVIQWAELFMPHASEVAARAAHEITSGEYKKHFWIGNLLVGHIAAIGVLFLEGSFALVLASLLAFIGLYLYEHAFVTAPQRIPNS
ncbi:MAG: polysulfide reductase NrfD [Bdellovibrionales bacterium]|nr:polysulfide reductase NrfD [Bdellovibrionales bacterium]MCB0412725.1 polysulfide reductase NrfD [Bdellovibrionales bacterium]